MRYRKGKKAKSNPSWLVTFADVLMIILVLFVLLLSFSTIDPAKFNSVLESFNNRTPVDLDVSKDADDDILDGSDGILDGGETIDEETKEKIKETIEREKKLKNIVDFVGEFATENQLDGELEAQITERGVELTLPENISFHSGQDVLLNEAKVFLDAIVPMLDGIKNGIIIEGHTDNIPIRTAKFPSNWELSTARATKVVRYLTEVNQLNANRFMATGHGEFKPITDNSNNELRAKNRRVVIVILHDE